MSIKIENVQNILKRFRRVISIIHQKLLILFHILALFRSYAAEKWFLLCTGCQLNVAFRVRKYIDETQISCHYLSRALDQIMPIIYYLNVRISSFASSNIQLCTPETLWYTIKMKSVIYFSLGKKRLQLKCTGWLVADKIVLLLGLTLWTWWVPENQ